MQENHWNGLAVTFRIRSCRVRSCGNILLVWRIGKPCSTYNAGPYLGLFQIIHVPNLLIAETSGNLLYTSGNFWGSCKLAVRGLVCGKCRANFQDSRRQPCEWFKLSSTANNYEILFVFKTRLKRFVCGDALAIDSRCCFGVCRTWWVSIFLFFRRSISHSLPLLFYFTRTYFWSSAHISRPWKPRAMPARYAGQFVWGKGVGGKELKRSDGVSSPNTHTDGVRAKWIDVGRP